MSLKLKVTNFSNKHHRLKNPNRLEGDQFAIYKRDQVELGQFPETTPFSVAGLEPATSGFLTTWPRCLPAL